jgi:hypothetical protein
LKLSSAEIISISISKQITVSFMVMRTWMHAVNVNGFTCKDAEDVVVEDFVFPGFHIAGNTSNKPI